MPRARSIVPASLLLASLAATASAQQLQQQTIYFQDFQGGVPMTGWSRTGITHHNGIFTSFLGRFSNERATLTLSLPALPQDEVPGGGAYWTYQLNFSFYCIDSWDGFDPDFGPDRFHVLINNTPVFSEYFSNSNPYQTFRDPDVGRAHLGFDDRWHDAIYHLSIPFIVPAGQTSIAFEATGLQVLADESWGIDNVRVSMVQIIPAPGPAALLGAAALTALRRRRAASRR